MLPILQRRRCRYLGLKVGCCVMLCLCCVRIRGAGGGHPIPGIEHLNILNPQDPWGIENIVSYFTYFRAREKCTILIFICMEMGLVRYNVTRPRLSVLIWIFVSRVLCPPNCWCGHDGDWIWRLHRSRRLEMGTRARLSPPASVQETTHGPWSPLVIMTPETVWQFQSPSLSHTIMVRPIATFCKV